MYQFVPYTGKFGTLRAPTQWGGRRGAATLRKPQGLLSRGEGLIVVRVFLAWGEGWDTGAFLNVFEQLIKVYGIEIIFLVVWKSERERGQQERVGIESSKRKIWE